jgi:hypothetical protein
MCAFLLEWCILFTVDASHMSTAGVTASRAVHVAAELNVPGGRGNGGGGLAQGMRLFMCWLFGAAA